MVEMKTRSVRAVCEADMSLSLILESATSQPASNFYVSLHY